MFKTTFFTDQNAHVKTFHSANVLDVTSKRLDIAGRHKVIQELATSARAHDWLWFSTGRVQLEPNQVHCLEYIKENTDLILPPKPNFLDWVFLYYEPQTVATTLTIENQARIKIYGNGERIMSYDEPLYCDIKFMGLRLTWVNVIDGWIVT
jgi:hypothetical protein